MQIERTTFARDAYSALRHIVLQERRYAAGEKLSIEALSRELGVSRSPVWAAVSRLEAEGLLEVVPRQGVFVIAFETPRITALFEAREALEGMAARLAAERATAAERAVLKEALKRQAHSVSAQDDAGYRSSNLDFHHGLLAAARNVTIENALRAYYAQTEAMCLGTGLLQSDWKQRKGNLADHQAILACMQKGDAAGAELAARQHVSSLLRSILARSAPDSETKKV